ncbi:MAG TPA: M20 family metallopeptidase [Kofleriaceae bacterium]|nr:M20 family metallopeptidase [Kofleriaceae bacterium]
MEQRLEAARAAVQLRMPELWSLVQAWVEIESFTADHAGCERMAAALLDAFALPGLAPRRVPGDGAAGHVVATTPAWTGKGGVVLVGHHDTVFPPGTFVGFRRDEAKAYGPGVLDMKGGLAIIRTALAALADTGLLAGLPLMFVSVSDEEIGSPDGRRVIEEHARGAAAGLVFEAGRMTDAIVTQRKGTGKLKVTARGKAAHAGNDLASGVNAIWALARFIDGVQRLTEGGTTVNVGLVRGGTSANTVPAEATCEIDVRIVRGADAERLLVAADHLAREIADDSSAKITIEGGIRRQPLERLAGTPAILERYAAAARAEGLGGDEAALMGGGSDANTLAAMGVPAIDGLGPRGKGFHTHDEFAELATFEPRVMALVRYLLGELP